MANTQYAPRVLSVQLDLHIPRGLKANIRNQARTAATQKFLSQIQGAIPALFPWVDKVTVKTRWAYIWDDPEGETFEMPKTPQNTGPAS